MTECLREHKIHLMQAAYGLQSHAEGAPGGVNSLSGKPIMLAASLLEMAAVALGADLDVEQGAVGEDPLGSEVQSPSSDIVESH